MHLESNPIATRDAWRAQKKPCEHQDPEIPPKKDAPHPRAKEEPQQDSRRGEIAFRIKLHPHQRRSEGSSKPCVHQDPETPQRLRQNYVS